MRSEKGSRATVEARAARARRGGRCGSSRPPTLQRRAAAEAVVHGSGSSVQRRRADAPARPASGRPIRLRRRRSSDKMAPCPRPAPELDDPGPAGGHAAGARPVLPPSVVLLLHHEDEGSFGFIVNRPTGIQVAEILAGHGGRLGAAATRRWPTSAARCSRSSARCSSPAGADGERPRPPTEVVPGVALTQHVGDLAALAGGAAGALPPAPRLRRLGRRPADRGDPAQRLADRAGRRRPGLRAPSRRGVGSGARVGGSRSRRAARRGRRERRRRRGQLRARRREPGDDPARARAPSPRVPRARSPRPPQASRRTPPRPRSPPPTPTAARRSASCCSRASTTRLPLLHQLREPQGARARREPARRALLPLAGARAPGARRGHRSSGSRRRSPTPTSRSRGARQPDRRLGLARRARRSPRARRSKSGCAAVAERFAGAAVPRPPFWGGYLLAPERHRVLERPRPPPARPPPLFASRRRLDWSGSRRGSSAP